ncbi:glycosyltransferase family 4 protein [Psychromonas sp. SR45-3]|uniref:glycosyltransferase family 4 protein n=1 Tax=Psychromonas sp. SR45-3 TaxID=2760930 RepID=UPI0015FB2FD9|nr:glycosyltransferase family 4 protein [Psychromonas sp. SR45-3]MBB1274710.1 glycosyltransferase family 4 protein [Psychromonas sp. SR45-3]
MSSSSSIRSSDFSQGEMQFEHVFLFSNSYEKRNKFLSFMKLSKILFFTNYNRLIVPGWELIELIPLIFLLPTSKNCIQLESSIIETKSTGILWFIKKLILKNIGHAFPSGVLQTKILQQANYSGKIHLTKGVGIPSRTSSRAVKNFIVNNKLNYLYVGRVSEEKNLKYLVDKFNDNGKSLTIAGDGPLLNELRLSANPNISFLGYINNEELSVVYKEHDVFILPSYSEPWGLVIDEALWFGLPVVVSENVGCLEDLVINPVTGIVFKLNDQISFDNALSEIESSYAKYCRNVNSINFEARDEEQISAYRISDV